MSMIGMLGAQVGANAVGSAMGMVDELILGDRRRKKQVEQQKKLTDVQVDANKKLADYGAGINKDLASYSMGLQKDMWNYTNYENQRRHMEQAGLSPALMYGSAGAGGTTGQAGTGSANAGSAGAGTASDEASRKQAETARMGMALQMGMQKAQIENIQADTKKKEADANQSKETTITEIEKRDIFIETLKQQGIGQWLDNVEQEFKHNPITDNSVEMFRNETFNTYTALQKMSAFTQEVTTSIAKGLAETNNQEAQALLTNEKAKGYWQELMNATKDAETYRMIGAAMKLSAEFETGEFTNWKTWTNLAIEGIDTIAKFAGKGLIKGITEGAKGK